MKITILRSDLLRALGRVRGAIDADTTVPVLSNTLLRATENGLQLAGTNFTMEIAVTAKAQIHSTGTTTVPAKTLHDIVRQLPEGARIVLEHVDNTMRIAAGRSKFKLQTLPDADFSLFPDSDRAPSCSITISKKELEHMLKQVLPAVSQDNHRYYLTGVHAHLQGDILHMVATDGHKLAQSGIAAPSAAIPDVIVPRATVSELIRLMADSSVLEIAIQISQSLIRFEIGDTVLTSKLIDGTYPDYQRVIPLGNDKIIEVDREEFGKVVARVSSLMSEQGHGIVLETGTGLIKISMKDQINEAEEEMDAEYFDDAFVIIKLNPLYLFEIVNRIQGETLAIKISHAEAPVLIMEKDAEHDLHVLMPMRM